MPGTVSPGFAAQVRSFQRTIEPKAADVFANVVSATLDSIVNGSEVTGSPGQPVGQYGPGYHPGEVGGALKASWNAEFESPNAASIQTASPYAVQNEYGISATGGPYTQRSTVGGRHSVALTIAGFRDLVAVEAAKARGFSDATTGYAGEDGG